MNRLTQTLTHWYKAILRRFREQPVPCIFCTCMLVSIAVALFLGYVTRGRSIENLLFFNRGDTFMDFFNSIQYGREPYDKGVIYPPLMNAIYGFLGHFIPKSILKDKGTVYTREYQLGKILLYAYILISLVFFVLVICKYYSKNKVEAFTFAFVVMFSTPFLFSIERGNSILLCIDFLLVFYFGYRSEDRLTRNIALICLAIATSMKIYVVCFGLLLLREKKYKDAILCCIYGVLIFFVPFLLFSEGNRSIFALIHNILNASDEFSVDHYGYKLSIASITDIFTRITDLDFTVLNLPLMALMLIPVIFGFFTKGFERWKVSCLLCMCMIMLPSFSYTYTLVFLIVPLLDFIICSREKEKLTCWDMLYLTCFVLLFIPFSLQDNGTLSIFTTVHSELTWTTILENVSLYALWLIICIESVVRIMKNTSIVKSILTIVPFVCVFSLICVQLVNLKEYDWPFESSVAMSRRENDELYTQVSKELYSVLEEKINVEDNVFCFPTVPECYEEPEEDDTSDADDSVDVDAIKAVLVNWSSPKDYESLLNDPEQIKEIKPQCLLVSSNSTYENEEYSALLKEITEMGYMYGYKNIGTFSDDNSTSFQIWELDSDSKSDIFIEDRGGQDAPYILKSAADLQEFERKVNDGWNFLGRYMRLDNDIDLKNIEWTPIGNFEKGYSFSGQFNGNGCAIKNISISKSQRLNNAALFGFMNGALYNLDLIGGEINGKNSAAFAANCSTGDSVIINCSSDTTISGENCGTLAYVFHGRIENCVFSGEVNGENQNVIISESSTAKLDCNYFVDRDFTTDIEDMSEHDLRIYEDKYIEAQFDLGPFSQDEYLSKRYSNFYIAPEIIMSDEFVNAFNEKLLTSNYSYMLLNTYEADQSRDTLKHTGSWDYIIPIDKIYVTGGASSDEVDSSSMYSKLVPAGGIQYGPYYSIEKGEYVVIYEGEGMGSVKFDVYSNTNDKYYSVRKVQQNDSRIEYICNFDEDVKDVEFRLINESDGTVIIDKITLERAE